MPTLYVTEPGARVEKEYRRLLVTKDDEILLEVPLSQVSEVVLIGACGATTPALLALLDAGCGLTLIHRSGRLRGRLAPAAAPNLRLRRSQYACAADPAFCLGISRRIVEAKLKNCRTGLRRMLRRRGSRADDPFAAAGRNAAQAIHRALKRLPAAESLDGLRGLEGAAARAYFSALRLGLRAGFGFEKRTRRPPADPTNALLSLAYALLTNAVFTACQVAGLDPYDGFYHADAHGRPALALDLVEEFRPVIADSVALGVIGRRIVDPGDFEAGTSDEQQGVYLKRPALRRFLEQFSARLNATVIHPAAGRSLSYQKVLEVQARSLRRAIEAGRAEAYRPFLAK